MNLLRSGLVTLMMCALAGCSKEAPVQAEQDSGPLGVRATAVVVKQLGRDVEAV